VLEQLAQAIKDNPNVEIDIAATPGFYTAGNMTGSMDNSTTMNNSNMNNSNMNNQNNTTSTTDPTIKKDDDLKYKDEDTKVKVDKDGDVKIKMDANKKMSNNGYTTKRSSSSYSGSAKKSSGTKSTARRSESKSRTYASRPSRKSSVSSSSTWSLNMARSGAIAKKLVDEGVAKSRILVNSDNTSTNSGTKDFQVIISPKADTYYNSIGNGSMNK